MAYRTACNERGQFVAGDANGGMRPIYDHPPLVAVELQASWKAALPVANWLTGLGPEWRMEPGSAEETVQWASLLGDREILLEPRRLLYRWRGTEGGPYPQYEAVRDGFVEAWQASPLLCDAPTALEWTMRYRNEMPQGTVWERPGQWSFLREPLCLPIQEEWGDVPMAARWQPRCEMADACFEVGLEYVPTANPHPIVALTLEVTGRLEAASDVVFELLERYDAARNVIVRTFQRLTAPESQAYWGLRRAAK